MTALAVGIGIAAALAAAALLALAVAHATRKPGRHEARHYWQQPSWLADVADLIAARHHANGILVVPADTPSRGAHESASFTHAALLEGLARIDDDGKWME